MSVHASHLIRPVIEHGQSGARQKETEISDGMIDAPQMIHITSSVHHVRMYAPTKIHNHATIFSFLDLRDIYTDSQTRIHTDKPSRHMYQLTKPQSMTKPICFET